MFITENLDEFISIGELANLTGITTHTLRVWEKRYGAPKSKRLPSGHRRYPKGDIPRLKAIAKALESGYRPSRVVRGSLEELQERLPTTMTSLSTGFWRRVPSNIASLPCRTR